MTTFIAVDDAKIIQLIRKAKRSLIYVAPGVSEPVAEALGRRLTETSDLSVKIVLDTDPEVCRLGFGDLKALEELHRLAVNHMLALHHQPGIRVGLVVADDMLVVFSPTPRLIEAGSSLDSKPNAIVLEGNAARAVEHAVGADNSGVAPADAEIGLSAVTPDDVKAVHDDLKKVPPAQFNLARRTRVFSSRLQFVELKSKGLRFSQQRTRLPRDLMQADAREGLADELETWVTPLQGLQAINIELYLDSKGRVIEDPSPDAKPEQWSAERLTEAINKLRNEYLIQIPGYGTALAISNKVAFEDEAKRLANVTKAFREAIPQVHYETQQVEIGRLKNLVLGRLAGRHPEGMKPRNYPDGITPDHVGQYVEDMLVRAFVDSFKSEGDLTWIYKSIAPESLGSQQFQEAVPEPLRSNLFKFFDASEAVEIEKPASIKDRGS